MADEPKLAELVQAVRSSAKYRAVSDDLIRTIGRRELLARPNLKQAVKATKNKLHQVAGAYFDAPRYDAWLTDLRAAEAQGSGAGGQGPDAAGSPRSSFVLRPPSHKPSAFQQACLAVMRHHASTRERLAVLPEFYTAALASLPPIRSVLDLACGLNPLARAWMPLAPDATYFACDLYDDMAAFLNSFFGLAGIPGEAFVCDLISAPPERPADLALLLKTLPVLEQVEKGAGLRVLRSLHAPYALVSFPARSLGGRGRGMVEHYGEQFAALVEGEGWSAQRFEFATELAFLVQK